MNRIRMQTQIYSAPVKVKSPQRSRKRRLRASAAKVGNEKLAGHLSRAVDLTAKPFSSRLQADIRQIENQNQPYLVHMSNNGQELAKNFI